MLIALIDINVIILEKKFHFNEEKVTNFIILGKVSKEVKILQLQSFNGKLK
jgi:hypothetical protein